MSIVDRIDLLQPPVTAARITPAGLAPSFKRLAGDEWELTTSAADSAAALKELEQLDPAFDWTGFTAELVEAKADPAAWHRDVAYDENGRKTPAVTRPVVRKRYLIRRSAPESVRNDLVKYVLSRKPAKHAQNSSGGALVVCPSDQQWGKVDAHGGTTETLDELQNRLDAAWAVARKMKPERIFILDPGDLIENVENHAGQLATNDMSLPAQLDLANAVTVRMITDAAKIAPVTYATVPSNHGQYRRSGQKVGTPADDFGILNAKTLARIFATAGRDDVHIVIPEQYAESLTIDVDGLNVGLVHGHQRGRPEQIPDWWAAQTFGGQPLAAADLLISGHWHHFRVQQLGHKMWIQCPTVDGGSAWYTNLSGQDAPRGLLIFQVVAGNVDHIRVL